MENLSLIPGLQILMRNYFSLFHGCEDEDDHPSSNFVVEDNLTAWIVFYSDGQRVIVIRYDTIVSIETAKDDDDANLHFVLFSACSTRT